MKKKLGIILGLSCAAATCLAFASCKEKSALDEYREKGYVISVTYDANGGKFVRQENVKIIDMFNPADYEKDEEGKVHIKLTSPTDPSRPTTTNDPVTLTKTEHSLAGWYTTRELLKNEKDEIVDEAGNVLTEKDGMYFDKQTDADGKEREVVVYDGIYFYEGESSDGDIVKNTESNKYIYERSKKEAVAAETVTPAYIYSGYWDFENDTLEYSEEEGVKEITLYAGWVPYYHYYYYCENESGEWEKYGDTYFDYVAAFSGDERYADQGEMHVPGWEGGNGAMNYTSYKYNDGSVKAFPSVAGKTFKAAYTDKECTQEITDKIIHGGTLDLEKGLAVNRIQNIYVQFYDEERFKIETAEQLSSHATLGGNYEILADLDFRATNWPALFTSGEFTGSMYSSSGNTFKIVNVNAKYSAASAYGGLFGRIADGAKVENLRFENIVTDIVEATSRETDTSYGLFAGEIGENAVVRNVTIANAKLRLGKVSLQEGYRINLLANGNLSGITQEGETALEAYGQAMALSYLYSFNEQTIKINVAQKTIELEFLYKATEQIRYSEYYTITWDSEGNTVAAPGGTQYSQAEQAA